MGGIPQYATYLVHRLFDERMKISHLINLAVYVISETATQDPKVGGPIRVATISKEKGYLELSEEDVHKIQIRNEDHNKELRGFFYGEEKNG